MNPSDKDNPLLDDAERAELAKRDEAALMTPEQVESLFSDTMGKPTSMLDNLTVYRAGKEDYFRRGEEKVPSVLGVILFSQRPMRTWWASAEISDKPPECYSIDGIKPDADSDNVQADTCAECPWDKFGTAEKGRGKACKTRAADFVLELSEAKLGTVPGITRNSIHQIELSPQMIVGPALVRYGIGNREAAENYQHLMRFARERGTYPQGLVCRWSFSKGESKGGVKYDVVKMEPVCSISQDSIRKVIVPLVLPLKKGQAIEVLKALAGGKEDGVSAS